MKSAAIQVGALLVIAIVLVAAAVVYTQADKALGASAGGSYTYHHYSSTHASSAVRTIVHGGAGELGSITVNSTGAQQIRLYDAASTTAATSTLTQIAALKPSVAEQTFTFDVAFAKGLTIEIPATYAGDITIAAR